MDSSYSITIDENKMIDFFGMSSIDRNDFEKSWYKSNIYRVPRMQRVGREDKYEPQAISIGPYHRGRGDLVLHTDHKRYYLHSLISRNTTPTTMLNTMFHKIREVLDEARSCYAERVDISDDEFLEMLVVDGCFIVELLYRYELKDQMPRGFKDILFSSNWVIPSIRRDLVLLENQIPFNVLAILFELSGYSNAPYHSQTDSPTQTKSSLLVELLINFFRPILPTVPSAPSYHNLEGKHILDLLRNHLVQINPIHFHLGNKPTWEHTTTATDLNQGGVQFKRKCKSRGLFDVTFQNGCLEMPPFYFGQSWTVLIPNMIALEQCCGDYMDIVTSYAILMDSLIDSPKDVKILRNARIIEGSSREDETIAYVVNNLCKDITFGNFYYDGLCNRVNKYRHTSWNIWRANLMKNYYYTPWAGISFGAAIMLLILTLVQTVVAVSQWSRTTS